MHEVDPNVEIVDHRKISKDEIIEYIPKYIDERRALGKSEATLHTDLAALCRALDVSMSRFDTIHRGQPTRGANLHEIRREHAQELYEYFKDLLKDPEERDKMKDILERRFNENPLKRDKFDRDLMDKEYV